MNVYPNPTTDKFFINVAIDRAGEGMLQVTDLVGHVIAQKRVGLVVGMNSLDFSLGNQLPEGFYNVSLTIDGRVGHQKILKAK